MRNYRLISALAVFALIGGLMFSTNAGATTDDFADWTCPAGTIQLLGTPDCWCNTGDPSQSLLIATQGLDGELVIIGDIDACVKASNEWPYGVDRPALPSADVDEPSVDEPSVDEPSVDVVPLPPIAAQPVTVG